MGAGLPQLLSLASEAKSYAERLFDYPIVDKLDKFAAEAAIRKPAQHLNVDYEDAAVESIIVNTQGYPYFLQEWGKHAWDLDPIVRVILPNT